MYRNARVPLFLHNQKLFDSSQRVCFLNAVQPQASCKPVVFAQKQEDVAAAPGELGLVMTARTQRIKLVAVPVKNRFSRTDGALVS